MTVHKRDSLANGVFAYHCVRIQQEHVLALGAPYGYVVGAWEPQVLLVLDENNVIKTRLEVINAAVIRTIVDNTYFGIYSR